jgi:hypothetical protein
MREMEHRVFGGRYEAALTFVLAFSACGGATATGRAPGNVDGEAQAQEAATAPCPSDMVMIARRFCIDRFEASMVDDATERPISPFYPPARNELRLAVIGQKWRDAALGKGEQLEPEVPLLPGWEWTEETSPRAVSRPRTVPQGYVSETTAARACARAGKRLCKWEEWVTACRGEQDTPFPYGPKYRRGACNVSRGDHPAAILYGNASIGHWDPRLNQVQVHGEPLLRATGETAECRSAWGDDAVYDMVGNLDEWIDDPEGTFVGGFYSRDTVRGCEARVTEHPRQFFDYSTGVRCCAELR